jgi:hypothetical protein
MSLRPARRALLRIVPSRLARRSCAKQRAPPQMSSSRMPHACHGGNDTTLRRRRRTLSLSAHWRMVSWRAIYNILNKDGFHVTIAGAATGLGKDATASSADGPVVGRSPAMAASDHGSGQRPSAPREAGALQPDGRPRPLMGLPRQRRCGGYQSTAPTSRISTSRRRTKTAADVPAAEARRMVAL